MSLRNRTRAASRGRDRFGYIAMWFSIIPPIGFAVIVRVHRLFTDGFGSFSTLSPPLGYLGCLFIVFGMSIRLAAVATLKKQFTDRVSIVEKHELVDTGIYSKVRHPAYLGNLASLLGFGLASANCIRLAVLVVLPLTATWYRIRIKEKALLQHFGPAYQDYSSRTKKLLPGIY